MNYLDRNTLPKFQERLDLAASELNDAEDILVAAINELAGRIYIISSLVPESERAQYAEELSYPIVTKINSLQTQIDSINAEIEEIRGSYDEQIDSLSSRLTDLETRLNALDDAAARKADLNVVLYRTGGPYPVVQEPSTCSSRHGSHISTTGDTITITNVNGITDYKHYLSIRIHGVNVDPQHRYDGLAIAKGVGTYELVLDPTVFNPFVGEEDALDLELATYIDYGDGTSQYLGTTVTHLTLV